MSTLEIFFCNGINVIYRINCSCSVPFCYEFDDAPAAKHVRNSDFFWTARSLLNFVWKNWILTNGMYLYMCIFVGFWFVCKRKKKSELSSVCQQYLLSIDTQENGFNRKNSISACYICWNIRQLALQTCACTNTLILWLSSHALDVWIFDMSSFRIRILDLARFCTIFFFLLMTVYHEFYSWMQADSRFSISFVIKLILIEFDIWTKWRIAIEICDCHCNVIAMKVTI